MRRRRQQDDMIGAIIHLEMVVIGALLGLIAGVLILRSGLLDGFKITIGG